MRAPTSGSGQSARPADQHLCRRAFVAASGAVAATILAAGGANARPAPRPVRLKGLWGDQGDGRFVNPILPADYSDIDVIQADDRYVAISSTLHTAPGMVVMESTDLVNWDVLGHAVDDITPLGENLSWRRMDGYGRGVWAGALRFHGGRFHLYFTCPDSGLYATSAERPQGPWTPLRCLWAVSGHNDPCPFWDDDGQAYLVMTRFAPDPVTNLRYSIFLYRLSADGQAIDIASAREIHRSNGSEASKLYKFGGHYYHYFSEVRPEGRVAMMRRSPSLNGPWEERQLNHVAAAIDKEPNQGGLVQARDGAWWFLTHQGTGDWAGRALCLLPVRWIDGWPVLGEPGADGVGNMVWSSPKPLAGRGRRTVPRLSDDFSSAALGPQWEWNHAPRPEMWSLTAKPGALRLSAFPPAKAGFAGVGNVASQRSWGAARGRVVAQLDVSAMADGQVAGLSHASKGHAYLGVAQEGGTRRLVFSSDGGQLEGPTLAGAHLWLRSDWDIDGEARFSFSLDGRRYRDLGPTHKLGWGHYRGDRIGLFTFNPEGEAGHALFGRFDYDVADQNGRFPG